jgi:hypothetical protein
MVNLVCQWKNTKRQIEGFISGIRMLEMAENGDYENIILTVVMRGTDFFNRWKNAEDAFT